MPLLPIALVAGALAYALKRNQDRVRDPEPVPIPLEPSPDLVAELDRQKRQNARLKRKLAQRISPPVPVETPPEPIPGAET
jgi:hypothetical protein